jgi:hypothetical protein
MMNDDGWEGTIAVGAREKRWDVIDPQRDAFEAVAANAPQLS